MALSQLQCLDDNHVNLRTNESKPEFLYSENQRLALEALLRNGREGFFKCLEARGLRGFLSDPELETLVGSVEPYDPDSELFLENAEEDEPPLSLHYWPELSDMSIPQMDLGWPDTESYRGVTRTAVYSQPPLEGQAHIKEVVRKMIAQAYKVIAVVMDVFTDVDIFRDLLDVSFKKKVSVYILLERSSLPHFLSMCQRANMHAGHLKHLRVRCTGGTEFYSRSSTKVRGQMGHRFMFVDGDKAMSGSYSFTWTSSRLEKNLITVVTGQAVEAFDRIYRILYSTSSFVNLQPVATEPEPEPEPVPQPVSAPPPSAEVARKLHNPKYALVNLGNPFSKNSPQETPNTEKSKGPEAVNKRGRKEALQEAPPLHPGLANLEKVSMMAYLPTWPDPDPTQDVIGYINIRDTRQTNQVHLQRSDFENSQAVRFSSPFSMPKKPLPEVATLRQLPGKPKEVNQLLPAQHTTKAKESQVDRASVNAGLDETKSKPGTAQQNSPESGPKCESNKDKTVNLNIENKHGPNATTNQQAAQNTAPQLNAHTPLQSSADKSSCVPQGPTEPGSNTKTETQVNSTQTLHTDLMKEQHTPHSVSHTQAVHIQSQNPSENSANASSSVPPLTSSSATPTQPVPSSSEASSAPPTSAPPVPKPRTIQLLIKDGITSDGKKLLECSVAKKPESSTGSLVVQNEFAIVTELETSPDKAPEIVPDCQSSESSTGAGRDAKSTVEMKDDPQQKEGGNLTTEESRVESVNAQEVVPNPPEPKRVTTIGDKLPPQIDKELIETEASESTTTCSELAEAPNKNSDNITNCKTNSGKEAELSKISANESVPTGTGALETVDSTNTHSTSKAPEGKHTPEKPFHLQLAETHTPDLRSLTPDGELRLTKALARTPTPDGIHSRTPTPDSRTHTPDPRSYTPDFRTPTPDVSDGYVSAIEDSNLSTTSEDYYDCVDHGMTEDHASLTQTHSPNATNGNRNHCMRTISSETQSLSRPAEVSSSSSSLEKAEEKEEEETADKNKEAPSRAPKKNKVLNQSAAERPVSGGANDGVEPKRLSTGDPPPKTVCTEIDVADKEKKPLGPGVVARREKPPTSRESEGKKLVKTSSKSPEDQKQQDGASSPSRPTRSPQPLSGQCLESSLQNKAESTLLHGGFQVFDNVSSPKKSQMRTPPPGKADAIGSAAKQRHSQVSRSKQSLVPPQPLADGQKPQSPLLHRHSNSQLQLSPPSQNQTLSANHKVEGRGPFSLTFSRLYSLKDLKDKMSNLSVQSKKSSTPTQGGKSTS